MIYGLLVAATFLAGINSARSPWHITSTQEMDGTRGMRRFTKPSDTDLFKLTDAIVSRGNLKKTVTDKPVPITIKLRRVEEFGVYEDSEGNMYALMDDEALDSPIARRLAKESKNPFAVWEGQMDTAPQRGFTNAEGRLVDGKL